MSDTTMELETTHDASAAVPLDERTAQAQARLDELTGELAAVDAQLATFAGERDKHKLLEQARQALQQLNQAGGADLLSKGEWAEQIAQADAVRAQIDAIEARRRELVEQISAQNEALLLLEDEAFEHQDQLERQYNEWTVERELEASRARPHLMLWMRGDEDRRSRKALAIALGLFMVFALVLPFIKIPSLPALVPEPLPERVVTVIPEAKKLKQAPPPPDITKPVTKKVERKKPTQTAKVEPRPVQVAKSPPAPKPLGILAFKESLNADDMPVVAKLGKGAKLMADAGAARPGRAMLTGNQPGSSSGINLASESRSFNKGNGERAGIKGVALTKASSGIKANAADAAANSSARRGGRSDEEIQIVFDRHKSALYRLYQRELRNDATLQGKVILRLTIEPDGSVSMAQVKSSEMDAPGMTSDIVARVRGFNFGEKDVPAVTIVYPMNFLPAG